MKYLKIHKLVKYAGEAGIISAVSLLSGCSIFSQCSEKAIIGHGIESVLEAGKDRPSKEAAHTYSVDSSKIEFIPFDAPPECPCQVEQSIADCVKEITHIPQFIPENEFPSSVYVLPELHGQTFFSSSIPKSETNNNMAPKTVDIPNPVKQNIPEMPYSSTADWTWLLLSTLVNLGFFWGVRNLLRQKSFKASAFEKAYSFLASLPELSRPGIVEKDVSGFLQKYSPSTPSLMSTLAAKYFMNSLPDANQFSKLELMILANVVKNRFKPSDAEFCQGICKIVENYDRAVVSFDDLLQSVQKSSSPIGSAVENISHELVQLNSGSNKSDLLAYKTEYHTLIAKAESAFEKKDLDSAHNYFQEALSLNKRRSEAYFGLTNVYARQGLLIDAASMLCELIKTVPCQPVISKACITKAVCFLRLGCVDRSLDSLRFADDSDIRKYELGRICSSIIGSNSFVNNTIDFFKKGYYCYARPAFKYWMSTKTPRAPNLSF